MVMGSDLDRQGSARALARRRHHPACSQRAARRHPVHRTMSTKCSATAQRVLLGDAREGQLSDRPARFERAPLDIADPLERAARLRARRDFSRELLSHLAPCWCACRRCASTPRTCPSSCVITWSSSSTRKDCRFAGSASRRRIACATILGPATSRSSRTSCAVPDCLRARERGHQPRARSRSISQSDSPSERAARQAGLLVAAAARSARALRTGLPAAAARALRRSASASSPSASAWSARTCTASCARSASISGQTEGETESRASLSRAFISSASIMRIA